ncbi:MAG: dienelactone hydrolase family protein [Myxococcales bacterium]|nr:dienelactone hydrolase family protein [Myxococcales bacterium]
MFGLRSLLVLFGLFGLCVGCDATPRPLPASAAEGDDRAQADDGAGSDERSGGDEGARDEDVVRAPWGGLQIAERGRGELAVVLLHGYGVRGDDLLGFANRLAEEIPALFIVPAAPILQRRGAGRAWFEPPLSLHEREADRRRAEQDIRRSRARLEGVLATLEGRGFDRSAIVVAGFSQGAMMSLDLALHTEPAIGGVGFLSGGPLPGWPLERARDLRVLVAHGRGDEILPFRDAATLREQLAGAGAEVDFLAFDGGHAVPTEVQDRLVAWLRARTSP